MVDTTETKTQEESGPWWKGITRYQWMVLLIASAGWIFDVYEGQIFNLTRHDMLLDLLNGNEDKVKTYGDMFLGIFLLGGTVGGLLFGSLADRFGRRSVMVATILMYSIFSGLTFFATELWHVAALRFFVAMGVGGEWAVAASLVSEVFPKRARAHASSIFHATSVPGTWIAAIAAIVVGTHWRYAYLIGVLPALLILWVRSSVKETDQWKKQKEGDSADKMGSFKDLLLNKRWAGRAIGGVLLAAVGLGTFWSVTVASQDLVRERLLSQKSFVDKTVASAMTESGKTEMTAEEKKKAIDAAAGNSAKFAYGLIQALGGGIGLVAFGPLCSRLGRKATFIGFHVLAMIIVPITCFVPQTYSQLLCILPLYGFFTLGIHAGYAVYFPELFPTHLRATGTSFCFNGGRLLAVPVLLYSGGLKTIDLPWGITILSWLFALGIIVMLFLPETKGKELPE